MDFNNDPFFNVLFEMPVPRVILKADVPDFTIVDYNKAYQEATYTQDRDIRGQTLWQAFDPKAAGGDGAVVLHNALMEAARLRQKVLMPPFAYAIPNAEATGTVQSWWQLEIIPVTAGEDYLLTTTYNLTDQVNAEAAGKREQQLSEELAASNEELTASNEELTVTVEELHESREALRKVNSSQEQTITHRTAELTQSEAEAQALNEELSATNEELASVNEELQASNEQLADNKATLLTTVADLLAAKKDAEQSARLFKAIAENIPGSLVIALGRDMRIILVEGDLKSKMGLTRENYAGVHPSEAFSPERYEMSKVLYDRLLSGEQFSMERKGEFGGTYMMHFVPLKDDGGQVSVGLIIALDITEIRQDQERSAKLAAIIESTDDAVISKTLEGTITSWNKSAERTFGYKPSEIIGQSVLKLIPEDRQHEETMIISRLRKGERVEHFETQRLTSDGRLVDLSLTISPVKDKQGNIIGVSKIARDISERKRDELRKNDFIGMVSHELKTPLTSLTALIQVANIKLKQNPDPFLSGAMEKAAVQVKKMSTMINGFLNVSRLESGKILIDKQSFNLTELIEEVIRETWLAVSSHDIKFSGGIAVNINADADKIASVISNILANAVKYSPKGSTIMVSCASRGQLVHVSIQDQGIGIKPEDQKHLFDRYYRVEDVNTKHVSGFGIGLYLSAEIINRHDGKIWVESTAGKGSTFHFSLPLN